MLCEPVEILLLLICSNDLGESFPWVRSWSVCAEPCLVSARGVFRSNRGSDNKAPMNNYCGHCSEAKKSSQFKFLFRASEEAKTQMRREISQSYSSASSRSWNTACTIIHDSTLFSYDTESDFMQICKMEAILALETIFM